MKINDISLGTHNPIRTPTSGLTIGDAVVEGLGPLSFARGGGPTDMTVKVWVKTDVVLAGFAIGSQAGNEALARWCEEMSRNPDLQSLLIRWSSNRVLPQDGWWLLTACQPDYTFSAGGAIPIVMTFRLRAPSGSPLSTFWSGGPLTSSYTGVPINMVGLPQSATDAGTFVRTGAEGSYPIVVSPPGPGPVSFLPGVNPDDLFKAGCSIFDVTGGLATNPVPVAGLAVNANWLEARGTDHYFTGDLVLTNGLLLLTVAINGSVQLWCWNTVTSNWTLGGTISSFDNTGIQGIPQSAKLTRVSDEEVGVDVLFVGSANTANLSFRLQRGHRLARVGFSPRSYANTTAGSVRFTPAVGGPLLVFNEAGAKDQLEGVTSVAPSTIYPYASAYLASASWQMVVSLLYQARIASEKPTQQPAINASGAGIQLGDTSGPAQYQTRFYGIGLTGLLNASDYRAEAESATITQPGGGPAVATVADGAQASGAGNNAIKVVIGAYSISQYIFTTALRAAPPAGTYRFAVRVRTGTNGAGAVNEITFDVGGATNFGAFNLKPNQATTVYKFFLSPVFTLNGAQTVGMRGYNPSFLTTTVDWYVDEFILLPVTLSTFRDGPQDLAQQFLFERTTRSPVV